jgi:HTH-type transcriptional regulator/antitoxin HipB
MHPVRIGRIVRTLRRRRGWTQTELGRRAGLSQQAVSLVEIGQYRRLSFECVERMLAALDAELDVGVRWRGGELDKVLDSGHAALEGLLATELSEHGWLVEVEVTYAIDGDRGSIDLLAFHPESAALLVAEIKTDVASADGTLRRHDEKVRLGSRIARDRFGWVAATVSRLLVLPDASTPRRRARSLARLLDHVYPARGHEVRRWLRRPLGRLAGILFLSTTKTVGDRRDFTSRRRIAGRPRELAERAAGPGRARRRASFIDSSVEHQDAW